MNNEYEINERLQKLIDSIGVTAYEFSKMMGNKRADGLYKILKNETNPSPKTLEKVKDAVPNLNYSWLISGGGPMFIDQSEPTLKDEEKGKVSLDQNQGRPFYNVDFTLGFEGVDNDVSLNPEFNIDFPPANRDTVNWFRAKGNSMIGEINSGDYIALEEVEDFSWFTLGRVYGIVTKNGFRTIKRVVKSDNEDEYLLVSNNPNKVNFPDQAIPKNMIYKLFKVVYVIKDLDE